MQAFGVLDRYIGKTIFNTIMMTLFMLVSLSGIIKFVDQLKKSGQGSYDALGAGFYTILSVPKDIQIFFPMAALLGALLGLGMLAQRSELGDQAFRMQGSVVPDSVTKTPNGVTFDLTYNGATATVEHSGSEPALFENTDIPVVAEGQWKGDVFESERLVIKHDESYDEDNPDRIDAAKNQGR